MPFRLFRQWFPCVPVSSSTYVVLKPIGCPRAKVVANTTKKKITNVFMSKTERGSAFTGRTYCTRSYCLSFQKELQKSIKQKKKCLHALRNAHLTIVELACSAQTVVVKLSSLEHAYCEGMQKRTGVAVVVSQELPAHTVSLKYLHKTSMEICHIFYKKHILLT